MFEICSSKRIYHANQVKICDKHIKGSYPYVVRMTKNNGVRGYIIDDEIYTNPENTLSFAQDTFSVFFQRKKYFTGNKVKILKPRFEFDDDVMHFIVSCFNKALNSFSWGVGSTVDTIENTIISLPTVDNNQIDFEFMDSFIAELEAERIAELEAYLKVSGLDNYELSNEEKKALDRFDKLKWEEFNLKDLFGESTRGKRLKSADRIKGKLPFVTAGEAEEGVSDFIGNTVHIFSANTTTIDMFGSAKYRNYKYGGDDHVAVVHTEALDKNAAIFVTATIHKVAHNGQFNYGKNFYAKDADELNITLPVKDKQPNYDAMSKIISAVHKLVIKDAVLYADRKIEKTKCVIESNNVKER